MKRPLLPVLALLLLVVSCAPAPEPEPAVEPAAPTPAEAIDGVRAVYQDAYNAGDAAAVAALFTEDAWYLPAEGSVNRGAGAIEAALAASMATGSPQATIATLDTMVLGDSAMSRGTWGIEMTAEGAESRAFGGHYMTAFQNVDGEWKISSLMTNFNAPPVEGMPAAPAPERTTPDLADSPIAAAIATYMERYNAGDAAGVAAMYAEDAVVAFADAPLVEGREAIAANFTTSMAALGSPQLTIHEVGGVDLGDGWYGSGGWFETTSGAGNRQGHWMSLMRTDADGNRLTHWAITNLVHGGGM